jgi:hypothetical protein
MALSGQFACSGTQSKVSFPMSNPPLVSLKASYNPHFETEIHIFAA